MFKDKIACTVTILRELENREQHMFLEKILCCLEMLN